MGNETGKVRCKGNAGWPKVTHKAEKASSLPGLGQPAIPPPMRGLQQEGMWWDLSSCGLMKESRSWISLKKAPMSKLEVKVLTNAHRKEGFLDLGWALSRTSSSLGTFCSLAAAWGLFGE